MCRHRIISKLAISDVIVDCPGHLCRRKERNLRRRSVLPIKWRMRISIADTLCPPGIKFRAAVRTIRGAFKGGYKGVKSDSYWDASEQIRIRGKRYGSMASRAT